VSEPFTIKHLDEFERSGRWLLARRSLGLGAFGMNLVEIEPGGRIPEHDETPRDQEEATSSSPARPSRSSTRSSTRRPRGRTCGSTGSRSGRS
jgi:hypothetical protein